MLCDLTQKESSQVLGPVQVRTMSCLTANSHPKDPGSALAPPLLKRHSLSLSLLLSNCLLGRPGCCPESR